MWAILAGAPAAAGGPAVGFWLRGVHRDWLRSRSPGYSFPLIPTRRSSMVNLRIPGPTPLPDDVLASQTKQMINHRGPEFGEIIARVTDELKYFYQTQNDLLIHTGSGTGAMEAAVVNTLSPGERVMAISIGNFGDRFTEIARKFGCDV